MGMICASSSGNFTSSVNAVLVGKNIRCLRKKAGLTAARLGELVYVSPQAVCKWERGQSMPSIDVLVLLRNVFHISIDSILVLDQDQDVIFFGVHY